MAGRPAVPVEVRREVLFEARHHCAVCCEPLPLELAHIVPWHQTHEHSVENLVALCGNCHGRADKEKWDLRLYKQQPCALLAAKSLTPVSPEQKAIVDLIVASDPATMTDRQRVRLVSMVAAYAGVSFDDVHVLSVRAANSSRVRLNLPTVAAKRLIGGFRRSDPRLAAFLEGFELLDIEIVQRESSSPFSAADEERQHLENRMEAIPSDNEIEGPFENIEAAIEFIQLLTETIEEARRQIEVDFARTDSDRLRQALQLASYNLAKLSIHTRTSHRILNDLRTLRRLLFDERAIEKERLHSSIRDFGQGS